jgi:hypothetical protein
MLLWRSQTLSAKHSHTLHLSGNFRKQGTSHLVTWADWLVPLGLIRSKAALPKTSPKHTNLELLLLLPSSPEPSLLLLPSSPESSLDDCDDEGSSYNDG